jgi:hypothetical protein
MKPDKRNYWVFAGNSSENGWYAYRGVITGQAEAIAEAICYHDATFRQVVDVLTGEVIWEENDA